MERINDNLHECSPMDVDDPDSTFHVEDENQRDVSMQEINMGNVHEAISAQRCNETIDFSKIESDNQYSLSNNFNYNPRTIDNVSSIDNPQTNVANAPISPINGNYGTEDSVLESSVRRCNLNNITCMNNLPGDDNNMPYQTETNLNSNLIESSYHFTDSLETSTESSQVFTQPSESLIASNETSRVFIEPSEIKTESFEASQVYSEPKETTTQLNWSQPSAELTLSQPISLTALSDSVRVPELPSEITESFKPSTESCQVFSQPKVTTAESLKASTESSQVFSQPTETILSPAITSESVIASTESSQVFAQPTETITELELKWPQASAELASIFIRPIETTGNSLTALGDSVRVPELPSEITEPFKASTESSQVFSQSKATILPSVTLAESLIASTEAIISSAMTSESLKASTESSQPKESITEHAASTECLNESLKALTESPPITGLIKPTTNSIESSQVFTKPSETLTEFFSSIKSNLFEASPETSHTSSQVKREQFSELPQGSAEFLIKSIETLSESQLLSEVATKPTLIDSSDANSRTDLNESAPKSSDLSNITTKLDEISKTDANNILDASKPTNLFKDSDLETDVTNIIEPENLESCHYSKNSKKSEILTECNKNSTLGIYEKSVLEVSHNALDVTGPREESKVVTTSEMVNSKAVSPLNLDKIAGCLVEFKLADKRRTSHPELAIAPNLDKNEQIDAMESFERCCYGKRFSESDTASELGNNLNPTSKQIASEVNSSINTSNLLDESKSDDVSIAEEPSESDCIFNSTEIDCCKVIASATEVTNDNNLNNTASKSETEEVNLNTTVTLDIDKNQASSSEIQITTSGTDNNSESGIISGASVPESEENNSNDNLDVTKILNVEIDLNTTKNITSEPNSEINLNLTHEIPDSVPVETVSPKSNLNATVILCHSDEKAGKDLDKEIVAAAVQLPNNVSPKKVNNGLDDILLLKKNSPPKLVNLGEAVHNAPKRNDLPQIHRSSSHDTSAELQSESLKKPQSPKSNGSGEAQLKLLPEEVVVHQNHSDKLVITNSPKITLKSICRKDKSIGSGDAVGEVGTSCHNTPIDETVALDDLDRTICSNSNTGDVEGDLICVSSPVKLQGGRKSVTVNESKSTPSPFKKFNGNSDEGKIKVEEAIQLQDAKDVKFDHNLDFSMFSDSPAKGSKRRETLFRLLDPLYDSRSEESPKRSDNSAVQSSDAIKVSSRLVCINQGPDASETALIACNQIKEELSDERDIETFLTALPETVHSFKARMEEANKEKMRMEQELNELKLQLNQYQQERTSLQLELHQKEEVILKIQGEAQKFSNQYKQEVKHLQDKLNTINEQNNNEEVKMLRDEINKLKERDVQLGEKNKTLINQIAGLGITVRNYETTLDKVIKESEKLRIEHDNTKKHLATLEVSFSDVHSKYERTKEFVIAYKNNEEVLSQHVEKTEEIARRYEERYDTLKAHAKAQLDKANRELSAVKNKHQVDMNKMTSIIRRLEIKTGSVQQALDQKTKECADLAALCDEMAA